MGTDEIIVFRLRIPESHYKYVVLHGCHINSAACPWTFVSCFTLQEVKSSSYFQDCFVPSKRNVYGMRFYGVAVVI